MKKMTAKVLYKPVGLGLGMATGALATIATRHLWGLFTDQDDLPTAKDAEATWTDVLIAAALQGAIFALAKAAADRLEASAISHAVAGGGH
jgi:hypothetical protein